MPSPRKQKAIRRRKRRGVYVLGAFAVLVTIVAVGWYIYASAQSEVVYAKLSTSRGLIEVELYQGKTPKTVTNFVNLARSGFYDNLVWHRIIQGFVIQTGDPNSKNGLNNSTWGTGQSSPLLPLETDASLHNYRGYVAMAHLQNDVNSGSCQFFINLVDNLSLDGSFTVFGKVIQGMDTTVPAIASVPVYEPSKQPISPVFLTSVTISGSP